MDKLNKTELIEKITQKKEFSKLPLKDVEFALEKFDKPTSPDYQKIKLTRNFLRGVFSSFSSRKLFSIKKEKPVEWYLAKHKSTKERLPHYEEVYKRIFSGIKKCSIIDLGAGVNGFSYEFFEKVGIKKPKYVAVEAIGQMVELMNEFFKNKKINAEAFHLSLFEKDKIIELIKKQPTPRIIFLMKVIDSLETIKRNYSKELISELSNFSDRIVLSFATKSLGKRKRFSVNRNWILKFIKENFTILDDFEIEGERYIVLKT